MSIFFERPQAFWFLIPLIPAIFFSIIHFRKTSAIMVRLYGKKDIPEKLPYNIQRTFISKTLCRSLAWICLVISFASPFWGWETVSIRRQGSAVSFVFDISKSMTAPDVYPSRLSVAAGYAGALLSKLEDVPVSVVLVKGSGILAVPLTRDYTIVYSLLENLSPSLLTTPGSDIGKGIKTATHSFSSSSSENNVIVVFTDGDETVPSMKDAVLEAADANITVILAGFGRTDGIEILAGDGVSPVVTSLKENQMEIIAAAVRKKAGGYFSSKPGVLYVNALGTGSALKILDTIAPYTGTAGAGDYISGYEAQPKGHFMLFIILAIVFYFAGIIAVEFHFPGKKKHRGDLHE